MPTSLQIKQKSYVDDLGLTAGSIEKLKKFLSQPRTKTKEVIISVLVSRV